LWRDRHRCRRDLHHVFNLFYSTVFIQQLDVIIIIELIQIVAIFQIVVQVVDLHIDVDNLVVHADRRVMHRGNVGGRSDGPRWRGRSYRGHRGIGEHRCKTRKFLRPADSPYFLSRLRSAPDPVDGVLPSVSIPLGRGRTQRPSDVFMVIVIRWWNGKERHARLRL
jgi:hypothetical protein